MDVSICIVNWNVKELLDSCIESIIKHTSGVTYEIIIFDNASEDGSVEMIKTSYPKCTIIESDVNYGFARGSNLAAKKSKGKYILYLNPDTKLISNAILGMYNHLEEDDKCGAVGCKLINQDGTIQYTCAAMFPTIRTEFNEFFCLSRIFPKSKIFSGREMIYWDHRDSRYVQTLSGACIMIRRALADELNGFDENTFMYSEDTDLCFRVWEKGCKVFYLSTYDIIHYEGSSTSKVKENNYSDKRQRESNYYFISKNYGKNEAKKYKYIVILGSIFRILLLLFIFPLNILIRGKRSNYTHIIRKYIYNLFWAFGYYECNANTKN